MSASAPASVAHQERRSNCTVCGAPGAVPVCLPPPAAGTLLCPEHASHLSTVAVRAIAEMTAKAAGGRTLHGRRLHDGEALEAIRAWAVAAGYPVSSQGSVAAPIIAAYRDAAVAGATEPDPVRTG
ncbi:MAG: Lsr2 family protein [Actinobacteria bacterium]|nr:Lsr2 family protein [Actinomycetota bacterium]MCA1720907.1 Lsr2 family protein [Actinomycetota bacterium]